MSESDILTTMQAALCTAYPGEAWLVRDHGRLIKIELPHGTHTLGLYVSTAAQAVEAGAKLLAWREQS